MSFKLPSAYPEWAMTKQILEKLKFEPNWQNLESGILGFANQTRRLNSKWCTRNPENADRFDEAPRLLELPLLEILVKQDASVLSVLIPRIVGLALEITSLFPDGQLQILKRRSRDRLELSRTQVGCLLSHMFLCTILPSDELDKAGFDGHFTGKLAPTGPITFRYLHTWSLACGPLDAYLRTLLLYFKDITSEDDNILNNQKIIFQRLTIGSEEELNFQDCQDPIVDTEVHHNGRIGDLDSTHVQMDFANKYVGFGRTGTQEELILGMSPESCVVVLFNECLDNEDAIIIQGPRIYGTYSGYGHSVKFSGPCNKVCDWQLRKILAMNATPHPGSVAQQVSDPVMKQELKKAYVAFSGVQGEVVDTGHWGCGAFGGDMGVKALIQLMSGSKAGLKKLEFFAFGEEPFCSQFSTCIELTKKNAITVGQLWDLVKEFEREKDTLGWTTFFGQSTKTDKNILAWINSLLQHRQNKMGCSSKKSWNLFSF